MIKMFCDRCGKETKDNKVEQRLKKKVQISKGNSVDIEIMLGTNGVMNGGVICKDCLTEMLKEL
jgi:hypothetical protein